MIKPVFTLFLLLATTLVSAQNKFSTLYILSQNLLTSNNISISSVAPMIYKHPAAVAARNNLINNKSSTITEDSYDDKCASALSVNDFSKDNLLIYPNPTSDFIYVKNLKDAKSYKIFDSSGRLVSQRKLNEDKIDVRNLTEGNYLLEIKSKAFLKNLKFIKK